MKKLITILLLSSCNLIDPPTHVTDDLQPFVDRVVYEYNIRGVHINPIKVVIGDIDVKGRYVPWPVWDKKIIIGRQFYEENISDTVLHFKILKTVAHEFGHYMGRDHQNKEVDGHPVSLMCTECIVWSFEENQEYYFDELVGVKLNK